MRESSGPNRTQPNTGITCEAPAERCFVGLSPFDIGAYSVPIRPPCLGLIGRETKLPRNAPDAAAPTYSVPMAHCAGDVSGVSPQSCYGLAIGPHGGRDDEENSRSNESATTDEADSTDNRPPRHHQRENEPNDSQDSR